MRTLIKVIVRIGALVAVAIAASKLFEWFKGAPDGVGEQGFSFGDDDSDPYAIDEAALGGDVSTELIERLVCPLDKGPLELVEGKWLVNRRNGYRYPIEDGIPVMLVEVGQRYMDKSFLDATTIDAALASGNGSTA